MKKKSQEAATTSPELLVDNENLKHSSLSTDGSSAACVEHKETYVNMVNYPSTAPTCSTEVLRGTVESPSDDDEKILKKGGKTRGPFRLKQLSLTRKPKKLKHPELAGSSGEEKLTNDRLKPSNSSTRSSRLKKFFMLSQADPSRKQQQDISLKNLRHVL